MGEGGGGLGGEGEGEGEGEVDSPHLLQSIACALVKRSEVEEERI